MSRMLRHPASFPARHKITIPAVFLLSMSADMASTVLAQGEPAFTMPLPVITLEPKAGEVLREAEVISVVQGCESEINISYEQRNTLAYVRGVIESSSCPASHGQYRLVIAIRDENNERSTFEMTETWQRSDDEPLSFVKEYPIPENVDLTRVSLRGLRCWCEELPAE